QSCLRPGSFVSFAPHAGITLSSSHIHAFMQASARDALHRAAASHSLTINSAFRTLADQYVLYHSGACGLAATPGRSNHQSGRAVDVGNYSAARSALEAAGCVWLGSSDPVHFDCPGTDLRNDSVLAFQRLWNRNNPSDRIAEDGLYGPQTEARVSRSPSGGFATSGCAPMTCTPTCEGDGFTDAMCNHTSCPGGQVCEMSGAPSCVAAVGQGHAVGAVFVDLGAGLEDTSMRIPGAHVTVVETGEELVADASGVFMVDTGPGDFTFEASADGYVTARRTCTIADAADPTWCSIGLASENMMHGTLQGVVYDLDRGLAFRVIDAHVSVVGTDASADVSAADGSFTFELAPGEYTVEAGGDGIAPGSATCIVAADDTTWCSIGVRGDGETPLMTVEIDDPIEDPGTGMPFSMDPTGPGRDTLGGCSAARGSSPTRGALVILALLGLALVRRRTRRA
ncbi:MAG: MYXO-CTERM sorting domain-containing protein, partial [Sandaracinaceae bacterium]